MNILAQALIICLLVTKSLQNDDASLKKQPANQASDSSANTAGEEEIGNPASEDSVSTVLPEQHPECPSPTNHTVKEQTFVQYVSNCTCACEGGKIGWYRNGTKCFALDLGFNKELTSKNGECYNGQCILDYIPHGCVGPDFDGRRTPKDDPQGLPPVGCAFLCHIKNGSQPFREEYGYYPVNTSCRHVEDPGTYADGPVRGWVNVTYTNTTCKKLGNETLCREEGDVPVC